MKLPETGITVDTSNNFLQEDFFRISSNSVVFDLLRNKIYKDPIMAICREISTNARDAHREAGIQEKPIEILLPNDFENTLIIRDFGNGIPKDRMYSIYLEYGSSTKRDSNLQSGAFGLGAKTPFAAVDSFSIVTKTLDGYKRTYNAYIDETGIGKIALISESISDEPTGTSIIIPVNKKDYNKYTNCILQVTEFWDIKPEIKNCSNKEYSKIIEKSDNWFISTYKDQNGLLYDNRYYGHARSHAVIDGIIYAIDFSQLNLSSEINNFYRNSNVSIVFSIGEISLIASRDAIHYNEQTKTHLSLVLRKVYKNIIETIQNKVNAKTSYRDAVCLLKTFKGLLDFSPADFTWKDKKLSFSIFPQDIGMQKAFTYDLLGSASLSRSKIRQIDITNELYFNDLNVEFTPKKIINKILSDNNINNLVVLINENNEIDKFWEEQLQIKRLSSVKIVKEKVKRKYVSSSSKDEVHGYKLCRNNRGTIGTVQHSLKRDHDGIYVLINLGDGVCTSDNINLRNYDILRKLSKFLNSDIYAFTAVKAHELSSSWVPLKKALIDKISKLNVSEIANVQQDYSHIHSYVSLQDEELNELVSKLDESSLFKQYIKLSTQTIMKYEELDDACYIFNMLSMEIPTDDRLNKMKIMVDARYPILNDLDRKYVNKKSIETYIKTADELFLLKERESVK